jgi:hypothetical protein
MADRNLYINRAKIKQCAIKTAWWWFGNLIFGLAPILLVMLITNLPLNIQANHLSNDELGHLIKDGTINFFCMAIMGSITVDILLARKEFEGNFPFTMLVLGVSAALLIAIIYMAFVIGGDHDHTFGQVKWLTNAVCLFSFSFCTIGKINLFLKEGR